MTIRRCQPVRSFDAHMGGVTIYLDELMAVGTLHVAVIMGDPFTVAVGTAVWIVSKHNGFGKTVSFFNFQMILYRPEYVFLLFSVERRVGLIPDRMMVYKCDFKRDSIYCAIKEME